MWRQVKNWCHVLRILCHSFNDSLWFGALLEAWVAMWQRRIFSPAFFTSIPSNLSAFELQFFSIELSSWTAFCNWLEICCVSLQVCGPFSWRLAACSQFSCRLYLAVGAILSYSSQFLWDYLPFLAVSLPLLPSHCLLSSCVQNGSKKQFLNWLFRLVSPDFWHGTTKFHPDAKTERLNIEKRWRTSLFT